MPETAQTLTPRQMADVVGVRYKTILAGIKRGEIPATMLGNTFRIPRAFVERYTGAEK